MKLFTFAMLALISLNAMAVDLCRLGDTNVFEDAVKAHQFRMYKRSANHVAFTNLEKAMIQMAVQAVHFENKRVSLPEALYIFGDYSEYTKGKPGSLAGEILYFAVGQSQFAFVRYYPGDNEYGAFVTMVNNQLKLLAIVGDGEIVCKR